MAVYYVGTFIAGMATLAWFQGKQNTAPVEGQKTRFAAVSNAVVSFFRSWCNTHPPRKDSSRLVDPETVSSEDLSIFRIIAETKKNMKILENNMAELRGWLKLPPKEKQEKLQEFLNTQEELSDETEENQPALKAQRQNQAIQAVAAQYTKWLCPWGPGQAMVDHRTAEKHKHHFLTTYSPQDRKLILPYLPSNIQYYLSSAS